LLASVTTLFLLLNRLAVEGAFGWRVDRFLDKLGSAARLTTLLVSFLFALVLILMAFGLGAEKSRRRVQRAGRASRK
jgi:Flp pilus assembly protein TadG